MLRRRGHRQYRVTLLADCLRFLRSEHSASWATKPERDEKGRTRNGRDITRREETRGRERNMSLHKVLPGHTTTQHALHI